MKVYINQLYHSAVGSLQYLSTMTRPDITFAVLNVAKCCSKPTKEHWTAVKRIMRYLKGTHNFGQPSTSQYVCIVQEMDHGQFLINILNVKNVVAYHQSRND